MAGDDVDVVMGHVVEGEGVDVLGALFLECLRQARDDQRQRAGLLVGEIGQAEEKMPVPAMGWFAACKDSEGNAFHLWQMDRSAA